MTSLMLGNALPLIYNLEIMANQILFKLNLFLVFKEWVTYTECNILIYEY